MNDDELDGDKPTLPAFDTGLHYVAWCRHCRRWHSHSRENGHRAAHCGNGSPYLATGYVLRLRGPATAEILKDLKRRRPHGA